MSWETDDPLVDYYDSDYPWRGDLNWATTVERSPYVGRDVPRYVEVAREASGEVLEFCCGTGRVTVPMAETGANVTAVDASSAMLEFFHRRIDEGVIAPEIAARMTLVEHDITKLDLPNKNFAAVVLPFNGLMAVPTAAGQTETIRRAYEHLRPGGTFTLDVRNGYLTSLRGYPISFSFERVHVRRHRRYMKFSGMREMDASQQQRLYGWYDEMDDDDVVRRRPWEVLLRIVYPSELRLMLQQAGFEEIVSEGGYSHERFNQSSEQLLIRCVKPGD